MSAPRSTAFKIRVMLLLAILVIVVLYALRDTQSRRDRTSWDHTLDIAFVIVERGEVSPPALALLRSRVRPLEERLTSEFRRYHPAGATPFAFVVFGPVLEGVPAPDSSDTSALGLARHAFELFRFTHDVDARASVPARGFDARLYLVVSPPKSELRAFVEGASEQNGRVGVALAELDESMADFALFVSAHELFHTLGASDKYDAAGRTRIPEGLAEPLRVPRLPQRYAELMAENRPLDGEHEEPPTSLEELAVGPFTAAEIGWERATTNASAR